MISEAISKIEQLALGGMTPHVFHVPGDPPYIQHIARPDGTVERYETQPDQRCVMLDSMTDFISLARHHFDQRIKEQNRMVVVYNRHYAQLIFDYQRSGERAAVIFTKTPEYRFFAGRLDHPLIDPKDLRYAMRMTIRLCVQDTALIEQVSNLSFRTNDSASADYATGRESLGKSIVKEVESSQRLPDPAQFFMVQPTTVPDLPQRYRLDCLLEPDMASRRWFLRPFDDSWLTFNARFVEEVGSVIREGLKETGVPIYQGTFEQLNEPHIAVPKLDQQTFIPSPMLDRPYLKDKGHED